MRRRRRPRGRDALPAERLRHVRGLQGQALQRRDAAREVQGQRHRADARHAGRRGARAVPASQAARSHHADAGRRRPRLPLARSAGDDAVGRRGPAREARARARARADRPHAVPARRADDGPPLRRRQEAARGAEPPRRQRQHRARDRAQPRRHQDGRLDHRLGPEGGAAGGEIIAVGHARAGRSKSRGATRASSSSHCSSARAGCSPAVARAASRGAAATTAISTLFGPPDRVRSAPCA